MLSVKRILCLLAAAWSLPLAAQEDFVFVPQWTAQAQFTGYYVAKEMGFYADEGLNVRIEHPSTTQEVENRDYGTVRPRAFSLQLAQAIELAAGGTQVVNILQTSMNSGLVFISRRDLSIMEQRGASVVTWRAGFAQMALCMIHHENLELKCIQAAGCVNLFVQGAVDAALAMTYNEYYQLLQAGMQLGPKNVYRLSEHGYNIQEDGVYMTLAAYRKHKDAAERFARASRRGWEWTMEHPDEALEIVMQYVHQNQVQTNRTLQSLMLSEILRLQKDPVTYQQSFLLRPDMVDKASALMLDAGLIPQTVSIDQLLPR